MSDMPKEVIDEFLAECEELIEDVFDKLRGIEKDGFNDEHINAIYRSIHTVKGSSQLFGFSLIGKISHSMETALDPVRNKLIKLEQKLIDELYKGMELTSRLIMSVRETGKEQDLSKEISEIAPKIIDLTSSAMNAKLRLVKDPAFTSKSLNISPNEIDSAKKNAENKSTSPAKTMSQVTQTTEAVKSETEKPNEPQVKTPVEPAQPTPENLSAKPVGKKIMESKTSKTNNEGNKSDGGTIRVNVNLLDNLMNRVGELVLIRNQVLQFSKLDSDDEFLKLSQRLNAVTAELQDDAMKTRMQPIGSILTKFHRVARDLAKELDKEVELELIGKDTELDKTLIEAVKDPLTHIVRNCVDHGLESTQERLDAGKPAVGHVLIRSFQEGGQIIIEIKDDGKGIDAEVIGAKAVEKGVVSQETLSHMSEQDIQALIFAPGFSTAAKVSNISGRGVGMDVVKTNIEKIGGHVEVQSEQGKGTSMFLKIPLTLAIVPAMVIESRGEVFAVPQVKVVELVRVEDTGQGKGIEYLQGKPVYRLRGNLLPLLNLSQVLDLPDAGEIDVTSAVNIIVINVDNQLVGLIVDAILDSADIVVKPLSKFLKKISVYTGATIMGDGRVILILDVNGLTKSMNSDTTIDSASRTADARDELPDEISEYLHFDAGLESTCSIPLCLVNRLEEFKSTSVSVTGNQRVIKYRGNLLPLISVSEALGGSEYDYSTERDIPIIVVSKGEKPYGLAVDRIIDVVAMNADIDDSIKDNENMLGSIIHDNDVVVVIDALTVIQQLQAKFISKDDSAETSLTSHNPRGEHSVLIADDIAFFRNQVSKALIDAGYHVDIANDGQIAFDMFSKATENHYSIIVSDIEMPNLDGLGFAQKVREQNSNIPMIAVTTRSSARDVEKGKKAGFFSYLEKLDPIKLVEEVDRLVGIEGGMDEQSRKSAN